eukprot:11162423-Lingulodinium_polyedra.AAC.1
MARLALVRMVMLLILNDVPSSCQDVATRPVWLILGALHGSVAILPHPALGHFSGWQLCKFVFEAWRGLVGGAERVV